MGDHLGRPGAVGVKKKRKEKETPIFNNRTLIQPRRIGKSEIPDIERKLAQERVTRDKYCENSEADVYLLVLVTSRHFAIHRRHRLEV